jgi:hypothetical protein
MLPDREDVWFSQRVIHPDSIVGTVESVVRLDMQRFPHVATIEPYGHGIPGAGVIVEPTTPRSHLPVAIADRRRR